MGVRAGSDEEGGRGASERLREKYGVDSQYSESGKACGIRCRCGVCSVSYGVLSSNHYYMEAGIMYFEEPVRPVTYT